MTLSDVERVPALTYVPFLPRFKAAILEGRKTATLRGKRYGSAGEIVESPFGLLRILSVEERSVGWVRDHLWREEGVESPEEFERVWRSLHGGSFDAASVRWLHRFERVLPEEGGRAEW